MKLNCTEVDRKLWLYIDRELSASELARISAHLRECEVCSSLYHERVREARLYRSALASSPFGDKFAGRLRRRMLEEGLYGSPSVRAAGAEHEHDGRARRRGWRTAERGMFPFHRGRTRRLVTVAAMLLLIPVIVVIGHLSNGPTPELLGELTVDDGVVHVATDPGDLRGAEVSHSRPGRVCAGMVCRVGPRSTAHLLLRASPDEKGSRLSLRGPAVLSFDPKATRGRFLARLEEGSLDAHVTPRGPGEIFRIETPHARASVVGTRFELSVNTTETSLEVREGKVKFQDLEAMPGEGGEVDVTLESGPYLARLGDSKLVAVLEMAPTVTIPPAPAAAGTSDGARLPASGAAQVGPLPADKAGSGAHDLDNPVDGRAKAE